MGISLTRAAFRDAISDIEEYAVDNLGRRCAFLTPTEYLPAIKRTPLTDRDEPYIAKKDKHLSMAQAIKLMAKGSLTSEELAERCIDAVTKRNLELNAFVYVLPKDEWLAQARELDRERKAGDIRGLLHGVPISVKDVIAVKDIPNTASSRVLSGNIAKEDAASVKLVRQAGAIITGKTHTHEFALGVTTPQCRNPWDTTRDPGGSSGGSAITVATGMSLASLGTDTRASSRVPAALCGIVGFKPTFGQISTEGVITLSWSLDHIGCLTQTVEDSAILLNILAKTNGQPDYTHYLNKDIKGLKVGIPTSSLIGSDPDLLKVFNQAVQAYRDASVKVIEIDSPTEQDFRLCNSMGLVLSRCEAANYHRTFDADPSLYTRPVYEQLDEASKVPAILYVQAQRFRDEFRQRMLVQLGRLDALLMPTCRVPAPKSNDVERFFLTLSLNCIPWSFIGFPTISVPCGFTPEGLPVGAQLVAGPMEDGRLLAMAAGLEKALEG